MTIGADSALTNDGTLLVAGGQNSDDAFDDTGAGGLLSIGAGVTLTNHDLLEIDGGEPEDDLAGGRSSQRSGGPFGNPTS